MRHINEIIIHTTATRPEWMAGHGTLAKVQEIGLWHTRDRGWRAIGYHYVIDRDGTVANGRPLEQVGAHVRGHNSNSIGIALMGGFGGSADDLFKDHYTPAQEAAVRKLIADLQRQFPNIVKVSGHNEYANKGCPCFRVRDWLTPTSASKIGKANPFAALIAFIARLFR